VNVAKLGYTTANPYLEGERGGGRGGERERERADHKNIWCHGCLNKYVKILQFDVENSQIAPKILYKKIFSISRARLGSLSSTFCILKLIHLFY
jgi:hypothetical protein